MAFGMTSTARAKRVAKDLRAFLASRGAEITLARARQLTARLFGYADYGELERSVGTGPPGSEDHELDPAERQARRDGQAASLVAAGLPEAVAKAAVEAVRPTGRTSADMPEREVVLLDDATVYHPWRFAHVAGGEYGIPFGVEGMAFPGSGMIGDDPRDDMLERMSIPSDPDSFGPQDVASVSATMAVTMGEVVDASSRAARLRDALPHDAHVACPDGFRPLAYVHFGRGVCSSPLPNCHVEGCYMIHRAGPGGGAWSMTFTVREDDAGLLSELEDDDCVAEAQSLVVMSRVVTVFCVEGQGIDRSIADVATPSGLFVDASLLPWVPHLDGAMRTAWACLSDYRENPGDYAIGFDRALPKATVARVQRAAARRSLGEDLVDLRRDGLCVAAIADGQPDRGRGDGEPPPLPDWASLPLDLEAVPFVAQPCSIGSGHAMIRNAVNAASPLTSLWWADEAVRLHARHIPRGERRAGSQWLSSGNGIGLLRSLAARVDALHELGLGTRAGETALAQLRLDGHDPFGMAHSAAAIAAATGNAILGERILAILSTRGERLPSSLEYLDPEEGTDPADLWSMALVKAAIRPEGEAMEAIVAAADAWPDYADEALSALVPEDLSEVIDGREERWTPITEQGSPNLDEERLALLHRGAWAVEPMASLLNRALS